MGTLKEDDDNQLLSENFRRLQKIEESILSCLEISAKMADDLSTIGRANPETMVQDCKAFLDNIQEAQDAIVGALSDHKGDRDFEVTVYPSLGKATALKEKTKVLSMYVNEMEECLRGTT